MPMKSHSQSSRKRPRDESQNNGDTESKKSQKSRFFQDAKVQTLDNKTNWVQLKSTDRILSAPDETVQYTKGRENILVDMGSEQLAAHFKKFQERLTIETAGTQPLSEEQPSSEKKSEAIDLEKLASLTRFVGEALDQNKFDEAKKKPSETYPLEQFLDEKAGVCRHQVLFLSYLLTKLIQNKEMPDGAVYVFRFRFTKEDETNRHAVVIYETGGKRYLLDSMGKPHGLVLDITSNKAALSGFPNGDQIFKEIHETLNGIQHHSAPSPETPSTTKQNTLR